MNTECDVLENTEQQMQGHTDWHAPKHTRIKCVSVEFNSFQNKKKRDLHTHSKYWRWKPDRIEMAHNHAHIEIDIEEGHNKNSQELTRNSNGVLIKYLQTIKRNTYFQ